MKSIKSLEGLLKTTEAAELLRVPVATLKDWRQRDEQRGPAYIKIERAVRYRLADLQEYIQKHRVCPRERNGKKR